MSEIVDKICMKENVVRPILELFHSYFEREAESINRDFAGASCPVDVHESAQGDFFTLNLGCNLNRADIDKSDYVSLGIELAQSALSRQ